MKKRYFRLNQSVYGWGKGWLLSTEAHDEWAAEVENIMTAMGAFGFHRKFNAGATNGRCQEMINLQTGEGMYFHPMDFSGFLSDENTERFHEVLKNVKTKYWTIRNVDTFNEPDRDEKKTMKEAVELHKAQLFAENALVRFTIWYEKEYGQGIKPIAEEFIAKGKLPQSL